MEVLSSQSNISISPSTSITSLSTTSLSTTSTNKHQYQNYETLLTKSKNDEVMQDSEKSELKDNIEMLDTPDHIEIIKIIHECMNSKVYTVSNRQTMLDLNDLNNRCLWKIAYYVSFCLENQKREKAKQDAEKEHIGKISELEETMKRTSKLKISAPPPEKVQDEENDEESEDDSDASETIQGHNSLNILEPLGVIKASNSMDVYNDDGTDPYLSE